MAAPTTPRSVSEATRFTPTTPHASTKSASRSTARGGPPGGGRPGGAGGSSTAESLENRVARLRAAHLAAKNAESSRFDRLLAHSRRFFDSAHKVTVMGLLGFTAIAGLATIYTTYDMFTFNRKRRAEFFERQRELEATSLEAARLAYMRGDATEDQILLVEEEHEREMARGGSSSFFKLPSALGAPSAVVGGSGSEQTAGEQHQQSVSEAATWPGSATNSAASAAAAPAGDTEKDAKSGGISSWLFSGLKKEEGRDAAAPANGPVVAQIADKAKDAFEKEKENQRIGGPLDRLGTGAAQEAQPTKKGWW